MMKEPASYDVAPRSRNYLDGAGFEGTAVQAGNHFAQKLCVEAPFASKPLRPAFMKNACGMNSPAPSRKW
jgi:hypothetical protein